MWGSVQYNYKKVSGVVYKPHSVQWLAPSVQSSLWAVRCRAARCSLPEADLFHRRRRCVWKRVVSHRPQTISPLLGLAPDGGYLAICITANAGGLLHHLFTITNLTLPSPKRRGKMSGCLFLWPFSGELFPPRMLSDVVLFGVRTFLDPVNAEPRLPNQPENFIIHGGSAHVNAQTVDISRKDIKIEESFTSTRLQEES